jgi:four helix bundle protein
MLHFQKLDVYRCAVQFVALAAPLSDRMPRGYASLGDQLRRAMLSVPLNIAEGTSRENTEEKRFFRIARGSALECAAVLDAVEAIGTLGGEELSEPRRLLERVVGMLTRLVVAE